MEQRRYVVYKHTSPSGKVYIGITGQKPAVRWGGGANYRDNKRFYNAIKKYGWDAFSHEILLSNLTEKEAKAKEIELIAEYRSAERQYGYNVSPGGNGQPCGEENKLYGIPRPAEVIEKIAAARRGKPWSERQRESSKRYYLTHKAYNYGKKASDETREKLRVAHLGQCRPHSEETKEKIRAGQNNARSVEQYTLEGEFVKRFRSISEAARVFGDKKHIKENIRQCCHGERKTACGYKWKFAGEEEQCMTHNK